MIEEKLESEAHNFFANKNRIKKVNGYSLFLSEKMKGTRDSKRYFKSYIESWRNLSNQEKNEYKERASNLSSSLSSTGSPQEKLGNKKRKIVSEVFNRLENNSNYCDAGGKSVSVGFVIVTENHQFFYGGDKRFKSNVWPDEWVRARLEKLHGELGPPEIAIDNSRLFSIGELRKKISLALKIKFNTVFKGVIPYSKGLEGLNNKGINLIGWPIDIQFEPIVNKKMNELEKINQSLNNIKFEKIDIL